MPKRSSKPPETEVDARADEPRPAGDASPAKNPAAVALGRMGGLKGGKARAAALSKKKRAEIAQKAATARWGKKSST